MNETSNRYIIVGVSVNSDPITNVQDGMSAVQGAVEALLLQGFTPMGGLAMCVDGQGRPHLAQAMLRLGPFEAEERSRIELTNPIGSVNS